MSGLSSVPPTANPILAALRRSSTAVIDGEALAVVPDGELDEGEEGIILHVFSFLVTAQDLESMASVSKKWHELVNRPSLYQSLPSVASDGSVNWANFKNLGIKYKGTEGECFKCLERSTGRILAMKKIRSFPEGEGVPYYLVRELAVLKGMEHDHVTSLELACLTENDLHTFFPYVDKTLHDVINPTGDLEGGCALPEAAVRTL
ncbi:hypothetical protein PHYPSEUDO_003304 [Phytophthora pseudosyringae]|uniref:Protein kinase domain-containing protein n=1 Tax=Phytophthora pseudosyringae TaxID=221518 RepID=A0A8T1VRP3_9STRA|nr:hypothetical protein PHYPSEUDO_003304 [Phytophthora pseudosyringae]